MNPETDSDFYVYAFSSKPVEEDVFNPANIIYIGKGRGSRWAQHFKEVERPLRESGELSSNKHSELASILQDLESTELPGDLKYERHAYIIRGGLTSNEAYALEALMISLLTKVGSPITNAVKGLHSENLVMPEGEMRRFFNSQTAVVTSVKAAEIDEYLPGGDRDDRTLTIVVKGSAEDMPMHEDVIRDENFTDEELEEFFGKRDEPRFEGGVVTATCETEDVTRRGWNPYQPWSEEEARERAYHYWPVSAHNAAKLWAIAEDGRLELYLGIVDPYTRKTVLRYGWDVTPGEPFLDYGTRVGFPLSNPRNEKRDENLGCALYRQHDKKQLLAGLSGGIGFTDFTDAQFEVDLDVPDIVPGAVKRDAQ